MTLLDDVPVQTTAVDVPSPRRWLRRNRAFLLIAGALVLALGLLALTTGVGTKGTLDPESYEQAGGRALATVLRDQGVRVLRTTDVQSTLDGETGDSTVFIPAPALLSEDELQQVLGGPGHVVIVGAAAIVEADIDGVLEAKNREPGCAAAIDAGTARMGGFTFRSADPGVQRCYGGSLLIDPTRRITVLGSGEALTNQRLATEGDAKLGLILLGSGPEVRWLIPDPNRTVIGTIAPTSLTDLLPGWVPYAVLQLFVALLVLALWRGRRLGRVVPEPLPVVVRAAETVEGRGRLYRAAGSRGTAAEALRSGARDRLGRRLGAGRHPQPEVLVDVVSRRASRPPAEVQRLLYGPPPVDDAALVALARELDSLTRTATSTEEVAGS